MGLPGMAALVAVVAVVQVPLALVGVLSGPLREQGQQLMAVMAVRA